MATDGTADTPEQPENQGDQPSGGGFSISRRMLLIGSGGGGAVLVVVVAVVLLFVTGVIGGGNPQPTSALDLVPDDAEFVMRMDVKRILGSHLLEGEIFSDGDWEDLEDNTGIDRDDLSMLIVARWNGNEIAVLQGNFDLDDIRDELEDADNEENSYRGYEVWEDPDGSAGALLEEYLVFSDTTRPVENVLKNLYNQAGSIARADDDSDMKQILDKLPDGFVVFANVGDTCPVERCEGYGWAMTEVDDSDEEGTVEIALLFRNERGAERAADDYDQVADFLEREGFDIEDTEADGVFVTGQAIQDLEEGVDEEPASPAPPAMQQFSPATVSRDEWIEDCYDYSSLSTSECGCVYGALLSSVSPVPQYDPRWEDGVGLAQGVEAFYQCY